MSYLYLVIRLDDSASDEFLINNYDRNFANSYYAASNSA